VLSANRRVNEVEPPKDKPSECRLYDLAAVPAWILLGEPGSGKTHSFKHLAESCGGIYLPVAEFLNSALNEVDQEKPLFLDGLDEIRASQDRRILLQVRDKLKQLGRPFFRISCRSADWYGHSDRGDVASASQDGNLRVFNLQPLEPEAVNQLLTTFGVSDPGEFVGQVQNQGLVGASNNPQLLRMLSDVWINRDHSGSWPQTRKALFDLFVRQQATEPNRRYRNLSRDENAPLSVDDMLDASGYLFATLLLCDKSGIALDEERANDRHPTLSSYAPPNLGAARAALRTSIFVPATHCEERVEPSHRSIAEYLAARWIAKAVDTSGLPLFRVLNLLCGYEQKPVSGLRGLFAWLATISLKARSHLIMLDPMTILLYGDVGSMPSACKQSILNGIGEASRYYRDALLWEFYDNKTLYTLYDPEIEPQFYKILRSNERNDASQTFLHFALKVLEQNSLSEEMVGRLRQIATDDSYWDENREMALKIWLAQGSITTSDKLGFISMIQSGEIKDRTDDLAGDVLANVVPLLNVEQWLRYIHPPKRPEYIGKYKLVLMKLFDAIDSSQLPIVLDYFSANKEWVITDDPNHFFSEIVGKLLVKSIEIYGDSVADDRLFSWLSIGVNDYGEIGIENEHAEALGAWISQNPARYTRILSCCFAVCMSRDDLDVCLYRHSSFLLKASAPPDIGLWHFQRLIQASNLGIARVHFNRAMYAVMFQENSLGLSFEMIQDWAGLDSVRNAWVKESMDCEIPEWRRNQMTRELTRREELQKKRHERTVLLNKEIDHIKTGTVNPHTLHNLACVWDALFSNIQGDSPEERFKNYCDNSEAIREAAESGFINAGERSDLPSVSEIINLHIKGERYYVTTPCLLGMQLKAQDDILSIDKLGDEVLKRMICFYFTWNPEPTQWVYHLLKNKPNLIAGVFLEYAIAALRSKKDPINGIHSLAEDVGYREVAKLVVPTLLKGFPALSTASQLYYLGWLLRAGIACDVGMVAIIEKKLSLKRMDVSQRICWLIAGIVVAPDQYESRLWNYVGSSWQRVNLIHRFMDREMAGFYLDDRLSIYSLGRLIEILAPGAQVNRQGFETEEMKRGSRVRQLIDKIVAKGSQEGLDEVNRLVAIADIQHFRSILDNARRELIHRIRESGFAFSPIQDVSQILKNGAPTTPKDLLHLVLAHLDDIAAKIQHESGNLFEQFWNTRTDMVHKSENECRNVILNELNNALTPYGIECQSEGNYVNDNRADIRVSFRNELDIPIEIKGDWHMELWTFGCNQLEKYTKSAKTDGFGIYLVLWTGGGVKAAPLDGGVRPTNSEDLKRRLTALLPDSAQGKIHVRVVDVSMSPKK